jgi:hypothetical protein
VRQKNQESFQRVQSMQPHIQRERDLIKEQKVLKEAEAIRRIEQEKLKVEKLR